MRTWMLALLIVVAGSAWADTDAPQAVVQLVDGMGGPVVVGKDQEHCFEINCHDCNTCGPIGPNSSGIGCTAMDCPIICDKFCVRATFTKGAQRE